MKIPKRKLFLFIIFAYVAFSLYAAYNVFFSSKVISRVHRVVKTKASSGNFTTHNRDLASFCGQANLTFSQVDSQKFVSCFTLNVVNTSR